MYFESINIYNLILSLITKGKGRRVYYFDVGRLLRKIPYLRNIPQKLLEQIQYQISDYPNLSFTIHNNSITYAKELHTLLSQNHSSTFLWWTQTFGSDKVHIYTKKFLALKSFDIIKKYLLLVELAKRSDIVLTYYVDPSPLNQLLIPRLTQQFPSDRINVKGLKSSYLKHTWYGLTQLAEVLVQLCITSTGRRLRFQITPRHYRISKEILWEIGTGRRNDDFFVDGDIIKEEEVLLYYRNSSKRRIRPGYLKTSIENAIKKGYHCINFDKTDLSVATMYHVLFQKYVLFAIKATIITIIKPKPSSTKLLFLHTLSNFLSQSMRWDIFLTSFQPALNLSQEDPYPSHISDTIILNSHGCKNAGFQWGDDTQWRAITLAFLGYNIYFSWGPLAKDYWSDNWDVDSVISTGYLWGHHVKESLLEREHLRKSSIRNYNSDISIVALLDEKITPDLYTSKKMLYDFYALGIELIKRRQDIRIIAKPKRWSHDESGVPEIDDLLSPYISDGSFTVLGRENIDVQEVIALTDIMVSMVMGVPYLEAICCGTKGFNFAPSRNIESPIYDKGYGTIVFDDIHKLADAIEFAIDNPSPNIDPGIESILNDVDPFRDLRGIDRLREAIINIT